MRFPWKPDSLLEALARHLEGAEGASHLAVAIRRGQSVAVDIRIAGVDGSLPLTLGELRPRRELVVGADRGWFIAPSGRTARLYGRPILHRLFHLLVERRCSPTPSAIAREDLVAAVWEGERMRSESGPNRLHFSLSVLRDMGLRGVLLRLQDGYALDPEVPVVEGNDACLPAAGPSAAE